MTSAYRLVSSDELDVRHGRSPSSRTASPACHDAHPRASTSTTGTNAKPTAAVVAASPSESTVKAPRLVMPYSACGWVTAQNHSGIET